MFQILLNINKFESSITTLSSGEKDIKNLKEVVVSKTFESIISVLIKSIGKRESLPYKKLFGRNYYINIYFIILNYFDSYIDSRVQDKDGLILSSEEEIKDNLLFEKEFVNFFFDLKINHIDNSYPSETNIYEKINHSLYFHILWLNQNKIENILKSRSVIFKEILKYIFINETQLFVYNEIAKCIELYNDKFIIRLKESFYFNILLKDDDITLSEFLDLLEKKFRNMTSNSIYNIEYMFNQSISKDNIENFHLETSYIKENMYCYHLIFDKKKNIKKLNYYLDFLKDEINITEKFHFIVKDIEPVIEYFYNNVKELPSIDNLKIKEITRFFRDIFLNTVEKKEIILMKAFEKELDNNIKFLSSNHINNHSINTFPYSFNYFSKLDLLEKRNFIFSFPIEKFNYNKLNTNLWFVISLVELVKFVQFRNCQSQTLPKSNELELTKVNIKRISMIQFWKKEHTNNNPNNDVQTLETKQPFSFIFTSLIKNLFSFFFKKHLTNSIKNNHKLRLMMILQNANESANEIEKKNLDLFSYFLRDELLNFFLLEKKKLLYEVIEGQINGMKLYHFDDNFYKETENIYYIFNSLMNVLDINTMNYDNQKNSIKFFSLLLLGVNLNPLEINDVNSDNKLPEPELDMKTNLCSKSEDKSETPPPLIEYMQLISRMIGKFQNSLDFSICISSNEKDMFDSFFESSLKIRIKNNFEKFIKIISKFEIELNSGDNPPTKESNIDRIIKFKLKKLLESDILTKHL